MDNYSSDQSKKDINEIKKVKIFLSQLSKKKYKVIFRKKRFGMKKNWISAYNFMFKKDFEAHNARADVDATTDCYLQILDLYSDENSK